MKVQAFIKISETESVLWYEVSEDGEVVWHLPADKAEEYKREMKARMGRCMDDYLKNHPEASLWGKTNKRR